MLSRLIFKKSECGERAITPAKKDLADALREIQKGVGKSVRAGFSCRLHSLAKRLSDESRSTGKSRSQRVN